MAAQTKKSKKSMAKKPRKTRLTNKDVLAIQRKQKRLKARRQRIMAALLDRLILRRLGGTFRWEAFQEMLPDVGKSGEHYSAWAQRYLTKRFARSELNEWLQKPLKDADVHFAEILLSLLLSDELKSEQSPFFHLKQGSALVVHLAEQTKLSPREVWEALRPCLEVSLADFLGRLGDLACAPAKLAS